MLAVRRTLCKARRRTTMERCILQSHRLFDASAAERRLAATIQLRTEVISRLELGVDCWEYKPKKEGGAVEGRKLSVYLFNWTSRAMTSFHT
jgi:hypothetical protein